jgi:hypothetical protein
MPQGHVQMHARRPRSTEPPRELESGLHALHKEGSKGTKTPHCVSKLAALSWSTWLLLYSWYALLLALAGAQPCVRWNSGGDLGSPGVYASWMPPD